MNYKPTQIKLNLKKINLQIHPVIQPAFSCWQLFRNEITDPLPYPQTDKYYLPYIKLIKSEKKHTYYYFESFNYVAKAKLELFEEQPCFIYEQNMVNIKILAWREVLMLAFQRDINHWKFFNAIKKILKEDELLLRLLLHSETTNIDDYCQFAKINKASYEYDQKSHKSYDAQSDTPQLPSKDIWNKLN